MSGLSSQTTEYKTVEEVQKAHDEGRIGRVKYKNIVAALEGRLSYTETKKAQVQKLIEKDAKRERPRRSSRVQEEEE